MHQRLRETLTKYEKKKPRKNCGIVVGARDCYVLNVLQCIRVVCGGVVGDTMRFLPISSQKAIAKFEARVIALLKQRALQNRCFCRPKDNYALLERLQNDYTKAILRG